MKAWTESCEDLSVAIWAGLIRLPRPTDFRVRDLRRGPTSTEKAVSDCNSSSRLLALRGIRRRCEKLPVRQSLFGNSFVTILPTGALHRGEVAFTGKIS